MGNGFIMLGNVLGNRLSGGLLSGLGRASLESSSSAAVQLDAVRITKPPVLSLAPIAPLAGGLLHLSPFTALSWLKTGSPLGAGGGCIGASQLSLFLAILIHCHPLHGQGFYLSRLAAPITALTTYLATLIASSLLDALKEPHSPLMMIAGMKWLSCRAIRLLQTTENDLYKDCLNSNYSGYRKGCTDGEMNTSLASPSFSLKGVRNPDKGFYVKPLWAWQERLWLLTERPSRQGNYINARVAFLMFIIQEHLQRLLKGSNPYQNWI